MNLLEQETHPHFNFAIAYAAGYFDGEGHIGLIPMKKPHVSLRITIVSGDLSAQQEVARVLGGVPYLIKWGKTPRLLYRWSLCGTKARDALKVMLPFLRAKSSQARLVLDSKLNYGKHGEIVSPEQFEIRRVLKKALADAKHE